MLNCTPQYGRGILVLTMETGLATGIEPDERRQPARTETGRRQRERCLGFAAPAAGGAGMLCIRAWRGRGDDPRIHGACCGRPRQPRYRHPALSVPVYGE